MSARDEMERQEPTRLTASDSGAIEGRFRMLRRWAKRTGEQREAVMFQPDLLAGKRVLITRMLSRASR
jgi:hypothetical protein